MDGVVSVFENRRMVLHTTRSWDFIGLPSAAERNLQYERNIIIGMFDTGIQRESESFKDTSIQGWALFAQNGKEHAKLLHPPISPATGGRIYYKGADIEDPSKEFMSPRDSDGDGTHTASTAAGNVVRNASLYGLAEGNARGGVAGSRLAVYKICWGGYCWEADIFSAFEDAIDDDVDIVSLSLGPAHILHYFNSSIAIGSFPAMTQGILTCNSVGKSGIVGSITNFAPWFSQ